MVAKAKSSYKITNWRKYNESLGPCRTTQSKKKSPIDYRLISLFFI